MTPVVIVASDAARVKPGREGVEKPDCQMPTCLPIPRWGTPAEEITAAQAEYQAALARYEQVKSGAGEEELIVAGANLDKAEAALQRAQAAYDAVAWQPSVGGSPQAAALQAATTEYRIAKAQYELTTNMPTEADLQQSKATLARAEAQLKLAQAGSTEQELAASAGSLAIAEARLTSLQAGPRPEEVAVAEAPVQQVHTALERARLSLSRSRLLAPFDGTVSAVHVGPGEWVGPGMPVVELVDTTHWRVETRNVSELTIGRVREGQEAIVRVIAIGDQELRGRVVAVSPVAVVQQGNTTYTLMIELEPTDLSLRPGMNARVEILTD